MRLRIEILTDEMEHHYTQFLLTHPSTLLYVSNKYRKLLHLFLKAQNYYFIALDENDRIVGALPSFLHCTQKDGNVLNSLPFYGSNGGIMEFNNNVEVKRLLINEFNAFAQNNNCVSKTIVTSPFETDIEFYNKQLDYTFLDKRLGQITKLPLSNYSDDAQLMGIFHSKTRNLVRKAQKSAFVVSKEKTNTTIEFVHTTHERNIQELGGKPKPKSFFDLIEQLFTYGEDYRIYTALKDGCPVAALLVFYFNKTVEYFTPVVVQEFRALQPLSLLIFEAMKDAIQLNFTWWNWGGTWLTQDGVYHFKSRWGTLDFPYYYFTKIYDTTIIHHTKDYFLNTYPYFYVLPFDKLQT